MINSNVSAILAQNEAETAPKMKLDNKTAFDPKNYLNVRLLPNETSRTVTVRLLPYFDEGTPFHKVHFHTVKVNKEVAPSGWKSLPCPSRNKQGDGKCPFCEVSQEAKKLKESATSEVDKNRFTDIERSNRPREMWVVRCIERGHEDDGVKFWLFPKSYDGKGVYDQMMNIFATRRNKALARGEEYNVFDVENGKDMVIKLTRNENGKVAPTVTDDDERTPLSNNQEQSEAWLNDPKKWDDVYTVKRYDYMSVLLQGGIPVFDKDSQTYVNKEDLQKAQEEKKNQEISERLSEPSRDFSMPQPLEESNGLGMAMPSAPQTFEDEEDDLPF